MFHRLSTIKQYIFRMMVSTFRGYTERILTSRVIFGNKEESSAGSSLARVGLQKKENVMTDLGKQWREGLRARAAQRAENAEQKLVEDQWQDATAVIEEIPTLISEAIKNGKENINITVSCSRSGYLDDNDLSAGILPNLAALSCTVSPEHFVTLSCQIVIEWCGKHGLECYIKKYVREDWRENDSYLLCARPKA